jgi:methyl-accepting chemotaxis protein
MNAIGHFIGGKHVAGASGRGGPVFNPATGEQSAGIGQVSAAVTQLDSNTQQSAALVHRSADAAPCAGDDDNLVLHVLPPFPANHRDLRATLANSVLGP